MKRTRKVANKFFILTNDPSFTAWGWAVLDEKKNVIETGCIKTEPDYKKKRIRKSDDTVRRISEITEVLLRLIREYEIDYILSELPHGSQNANAAIMIGITTGIVQTIGDSSDIPVEWYSEQDCKKTVLGKRAAMKSEMIDAMAQEYQFVLPAQKYAREAIADALSIHYTAMKSSQTLKLFFNQKK